MADLADPRRTATKAAEERIVAVRPSYMLHGGLHSGETGSPEMLMELAYRLAVSNASPDPGDPGAAGRPDQPGAPSRTAAIGRWTGSTGT